LGKTKHINSNKVYYYCIYICIAICWRENFRQKNAKDVEIDITRPWSILIYFKYSSNKLYLNLCLVFPNQCYIGGMSTTVIYHGMSLTVINRGRSDFYFRELTGRSGRQQWEVWRLLGELNYFKDYDKKRKRQYNIDWEKLNINSNKVYYYCI
jgi:hypothetical protein